MVNEVLLLFALMLSQLKINFKTKLPVKKFSLAPVYLTFFCYSESNINGAGSPHSSLDLIPPYINRQGI